MRLRLECDGGSRGNPGIAGAGSSIVDAASAVHGDKHELAARWEYLAKATNNVAEYHGLVNGLKLAGEVASKQGATLSAVELDVFMDSKLIVEQMNGRWKIKHPDMKPLAAEAKKLGGQFASISYIWVPRAQNKRADELANRAMDDREGGLWFDAMLGSEEQNSTGGAAESELTVNQETGHEGAEQDVQTDDKNEPQAGDKNEPRTEDAAQPGTKNTTKNTPVASWHGGARPTRLLLLRHGQTPMSVEGQYSGLSDPELTEFGHWQAQRAAEFIARRGGIAAVVCSPLTRTKQTASAVVQALGLEESAVITDKRLIEMDFGHWEGRTFREVREEHSEEQAACFADATKAPQGGESPEQVYSRVREAIDELAEKHPGQNVLVVSHVTPIKSALRHAMGAGGEIYRTVHLDLASLSIAEFYESGATLVRAVNDTHYLY